MGTITITTLGFAATPASAPAQWPSGVVYPGAVAPNGSRQVIISDADFVRILTWAAATQVPQNQGPPLGSPTVQTMAQILVSSVQHLYDGWTQAVVNYFQTPAVPGTPPTYG
jgi:hypothetical protein